jgi:hypothetical protein
MAGVKAAEKRPWGRDFYSRRGSPPAARLANRRRNLHQSYPYRLRLTGGDAVTPRLTMRLEGQAGASLGALRLYPVDFPRREPDAAGF